MPNPRATVTIGGIALVGDTALYAPFSEWPLSVTAFDGIEATTLQDFGRRRARATGRLATGSTESAGLISRAVLTSLLALMQTRGATASLSDSLGNAGTIKPLTFRHEHEHAVPGTQGTLYSFELTWRWTALTTLFGAAYTGD